MALPLSLSAFLMLVFSHMGMTEDSHLFVYIVLGPVIVLPVFLIYLSLRSMNMASPKTLLGFEISVMLLAVLLLLMSPRSEAGYHFYAFCYSVLGIVHFLNFRGLLPEFNAQLGGKVTAVCLAAVFLSATGLLGYSVYMNIPKLPDEIKEIEFYKRSLQFHDDFKEKLFMGQLSEEQEVQGMILPRDTWLTFYDTGEIHLIRLPGEALIKGIFCVPNESIHLYRDGQFEIVKMSRTQKVGGEVYQRNTVLHFAEDGSIERAVRRNGK
jgi:hypothetical protein